jgi:hypothetical protein
VQKQAGDCAFSNACTLPGPRERLPGSNREFCHFHRMQLELPSAGVSSTTEIRIAMPRRQSRSGWMSGIGLGETF